MAARAAYDGPASEGPDRAESSDYEDYLPAQYSNPLKRGRIDPGGGPRAGGPPGVYDTQRTQ
jgi:hypothetical protein